MFAKASLFATAAAAVTLSALAAQTTPPYQGQLLLQGLFGIRSCRFEDSRSLPIQLAATPKSVSEPITKTELPLY